MQLSLGTNIPHFPVTMLEVLYVSLPYGVRLGRIISAKRENSPENGYHLETQSLKSYVMNLFLKIV